MRGKKNPAKSNKKQVAPAAASQLRYSRLWLILLVLLVYAPSFNNGFTDLDDTIFINENSNYNQDISNLFHSFDRGVFAEKKDTYYRPLLLDSFIVNYQICKDHIKGYHAINVLLHLFAVLLLFSLLMQLKMERLKAFLLSALFAVHPVLSQAVAWIPGRNDTLLALFVFAFMLNTLRYIESRKPILLIGNLLFLLGALFTKESALFVPFAFVLLLWMSTTITLFDKRNFLLYGTWLVGAIIWFAIRAQAGLESDSLTLSAMANNFGNRVPALLQYFGKTMLPFNLSVFPMMVDTNYAWGIISVIVITALLYFAGKNNKRIVLAGFGWFLIMLLPVVLLPSALNEQDFEHRLYIPFFGILLVLSQSAIFTRLKPVISNVIMACIIITFSVINILHQKNFKDPVTFWEAAVKTTPHSSYATMMLAARLDESDPQRSNALMLHAYALNPKERYVNFYLGKYYMDNNQPDLAEKYLNEELTISSYYETWFQLSHLEFGRGHMDKSIEYMEKYLALAPGDAQAVNNYILLLIQSNHKEKARTVIQQKQKEGLMIPQELINQVQ